MLEQVKPRLAQRIINALSRVTSSGNFIPVIDGMRFVAITSVFLYHLLGYVIAKSPVVFIESRMESLFGSALDRGCFGVHLFFVISGFIIVLPFAAHHLEAKPAVTLKQYFFRRITRLEPPYIICMCIMFALNLLVRKDLFAEQFPHLLASLFYLHNFIFHQLSTVNGVAWSLEVEIQFYILAPLIAGIFAVSNKLLRRGILLSLMALACLWQPYVRAWDLSDNVGGFLHFFLTGFLIADIYIADWKRSPKIWWGMDLIGIIACAGLYRLTRDLHYVYYNPIGAMVACVAITFIFYGAFRGRLFNRILTNRWIVVIGGMCYTIYLYHYQLISFLGRLTIHAALTRHLWVNVMLQLSLMALAILAATSLIFIVLEKPFMRKDWPRRFAAWVQQLRGTS